MTFSHISTVASSLPSYYPSCTFTYNPFYPCRHAVQLYAGAVRSIR